jgi:hypothetical protein
MKFKTTGATIVINAEIEPGRSPESALNALVTLLSVFPNRPDSRRLPTDATGELGSETLLAIWDQLPYPEVLGARSSILRRALESPDLLAIPPNTAAIDDCMPRETDRSGSPNLPASSPTQRLSSMPSNEVNSESAILLLLSCLLVGPDDGGFNPLHFFDDL